MHLQQTKVESRATGGPQYYFHNLTTPVKEFLQKRGARLFGDHEPELA